jgi:hypothetical protein
MAVYKLFPEKDTTIYSAYPVMNTGLDAILEVSNTVPSIAPSPRVARALVQFNQDEIEDVVNNKISGANWSGSLKLFIAQAQGINLDTIIKTYPASENWSNGTGEYGDSPQTVNGTSWKYINYSGSDIWKTGGYTPYVTGSYSGSISTGLANGVGGNWYTGSGYIDGELVASQSFGLRSEKDLDMNVTNIINAWYSSSTESPINPIDNNGFILKLTSSVEYSTSRSIQPIFKYYSTDTNTIYPPTLEFKWDDQSFETGNLLEITTSDLFVSLDNNPGTFRSESVNRFRLNVREQFPIRTFQTSSLYTTNKHLNNESLYAIKDLDTNEFVINFDSNFTKISCDPNGNYFDIYMNGLEPERYYKILIKTTINGSTIVKDEDYYFKVING